MSIQLLFFDFAHVSSRSISWAIALYFRSLAALAIRDLPEKNSMTSYSFPGWIPIPSGIVAAIHTKARNASGVSSGNEKLNKWNEVSNSAALQCLYVLSSVFRGPHRYKHLQGCCDDVFWYHGLITSFPTLPGLSFMKSYGKYIWQQKTFLDWLFWSIFHFIGASGGGRHPTNSLSELRRLVLYASPARWRHDCIYHVIT